MAARPARRAIANGCAPRAPAEEVYLFMSVLETITARIAPLEERLVIYPDLQRVFHNAFLNTVETTMTMESGDTFILTGDIHAMWQRDSTAQIMHYIRFADEPDVAQMIEGLIARQAKNTIIDPYANAFNQEPSDYKPFDDTPRASDWVWERKYEIDSVCYPVHLAWLYHQQTGSTAFLTDDFKKALRIIVDQIALEQHHENSPYSFQRTHCPPSDTLPNAGRGTPVAYTGMSWCGFRPSDDACQYGYFIPGNFFAALELRHIASFAKMIGDPDLKRDADKLYRDIAKGLHEYAHYDHPKYGDILAYETAGMGHYNLMDAANVPSLLALPYLGVCAKDDPLYLRTRAFVLSRDNPYYYQGNYARGVGSPHTPKGYIWPIALCVQAMTSTDPTEIAELVRMLMNTHAGCYCMHEGFDPDDPAKFSREWFAWANSMFGELIYRLHEEDLLEEVLKRTLAGRAPAAGCYRS